MKKRFFAALLAAALAAGTLPAAGAVLNSGDASAYLKAMDNMPNASSYLVDFDGDGSDELLLVQKKDEDHLNYEVWDGAARLASEAVEYLSLELCSKAGTNRQYLATMPKYGDAIGLTSYTVLNGAWEKGDELSGAWIGMQKKCYINGMQVTAEEFEQAQQAYTTNLQLDINNSSVRNKVLAALDTTADGYKDVLDTLSSSEKTALFEDLLFPFAGYNIDYYTATDAELAQLLSDVSYDHNKGFPALDRLSHKRLSNGDFAISKSDADRLTQQLFGRTLDFAKLTQRTVLANADDLTIPINFCYVYQGMLCFHQYAGMGSFPGTIQFIPQHLYDLGSGYFAAGMTEEWRYDDGTLDKKNLFYSVIKKNTDGTYRFIRTYSANYTPTEKELAAFVAPSSWAQAEISAADAAGLIPELNGNPGWQDDTTRLQFAQLAVRLAEKATGKTLPAAPDSTFTDCTDVDVRKAYAAGIVNGTSATAFSPDSKLTREQLATMLWRAADYIQQQTGEQVLTAGGSLTGYTDAGRVSAYAKQAVTTLAKYDIMKGTSTTKLSPQENCSVEQSVLLAYRMMQKLD